MNTYIVDGEYKKRSIKIWKRYISEFSKLIIKLDGSINVIAKKETILQYENE